MTVGLAGLAEAAAADDDVAACSGMLDVRRREITFPATIDPLEVAIVEAKGSRSTRWRWGCCGSGGCSCDDGRGYCQ
jgi:hypothetical protein